MSIAGQSLLATLGRVICMYSFLRGAHLHVLSVSIFFYFVVVVVFFPGAGGAGGVFLERPPGRAPGAGRRGEAGRRGGWERGRRRREQDDQGRQIASIGR